MTYCVAMNLAQGLVFVSDTRTNAGVDHIATFRKLHVFGTPGERLIVVQCAGNLATSQSVISLLRNRMASEKPNLGTVESLFDAARLVGSTLQEVVKHDTGSGMGQGVELGCSFLVGGQIGKELPRLFNIYPQGNFIESTRDTLCFQIGEDKYGKSIIDRALSYATPLEHALRCALISFDSTIRSNLSVGLPLDVLVYQAGSLKLPVGFRIQQDDEYFQGVREQWGAGLRRLLGELPSLPREYWS